MPTPRVFLLSPARTDGRRAQLLFNPNAAFDTAVRLRSPAGIELGRVFSFLSGLYFRGKLTYARAFAEEVGGVDPILVITPERGLLPPETRVTLKMLGGAAKDDDLKDEIKAALPMHERHLARAREVAAQLNMALEPPK
jgi:hypothetical protein